MSTIIAILEPDADGNVHLPVPPELLGAKIKIEAKLERADQSPAPAKPGLWKDLPGPFWISPDFDAPLEDFREYME